MSISCQEKHINLPNLEQHDSNNNENTTYQRQKIPKKKKDSNIFNFHLWNSGYNYFNLIFTGKFLFCFVVHKSSYP